MKFYLIAGERSGDLHGGNLIKQLRQRDSAAQFRGFGGDYMREAGMDEVVHYRELAFMGFAEVLANLRTISRKIEHCKRDILSYKPDVIVLIDYAGFNMRIASFAKRNGLKVFWYISPKVWAWNQGRALKLKANVDQMFVILPFEEDFFGKFGWQVDYVGNPVLDAVKAHQVNTRFKIVHDLKEEGGIVALLPGSRKQELRSILPLMAGVAEKFPTRQFVVAAVRNLDSEMYDVIKGLPNVKLVFDEAYDLLAHADAAIVTSGTATLETALFKVPQVVVYKTSILSYWIARLVIKVRFISLVNLVAGKEVVKEMIQRNASVREVSIELSNILENQRYRDQIRGDYNRIFHVLDIGSASENTAKLMLTYLKV
jgi:lipid-A-disaccharide synthase